MKKRSASSGFGDRNRGAAFALLVFALATALRAGPADGPQPAGMRLLRAPQGRRFGLIAGPRSGPSPTLFFFALGLESLQRQPAYLQLPFDLERRGIITVVLDPPAHGEDARPEERAARIDPLAAWPRRLEAGEDFVQKFTSQASAVLDYLVRLGESDPGRVAACGVSRGGFLALHFAAADGRVRVVAGISPVTDLLALSEFRGTRQPERAEALSLLHLVPRLRSRAIFISIGNHDTRVGTGPAIELARSLVRQAAAGTDPNGVFPIELFVYPSVGHGDADPSDSRQVNAIAARWITRHLGRDEHPASGQ